MWPNKNLWLKGTVGDKKETSLTLLSWRELDGYLYEEAERDGASAGNWKVMWPRPGVGGRPESELQARLLGGESKRVITDGEQGSSTRSREGC